MVVSCIWMNIVVLFLSCLQSSSQHIDDIIQWDDEQENVGADPLQEEEENVIKLADLNKPKWRTALTKYDTNHDGKLSGDEILLAYPEIQGLMENEDSEPFWWFSPNMGVFVAVAIGVITLGYSLYKLRSLMSSGAAENDTKYEMNRQQWLDRLEGKQESNSNTETADKINRKEKSPESEQHHLTNGNDSEGDGAEEELAGNLHKRKPEEAYDPARSKMPRYQQLSAIRRCPGNQSPKPTSRVYQQLLQDDSDIDENSGDEVVGNTRKRRQQRDVVSPEVFPEKLPKDCDSTTDEPAEVIAQSADCVAAEIQDSSASTGKIGSADIVNNCSSDSRNLENKTSAAFTISKDSSQVSKNETLNRQSPEVAHTDSPEEKPNSSSGNIYHSVADISNK